MSTFKWVLIFLLISKMYFMKNSLALSTIIIVSSTLIYFSCSNKNDEDRVSMEYINPESVPGKEITGKPLFELFSRHAMIDIDHNFLFINTFENADGIVQIYNLNGKHITSFGNKGKGPNELIFGDYAGMIKNKQQYWLYDIYQFKLIEYKYDFTSQDSVSVRIKNVYTSVDNNIFQINPLNDTGFVATVLLKNGLFGIYSNRPDAPLKIFGDYPIHVEKLADYTQFQGNIALNAEQNLLFYAAFQIGYISCYTLKNHFNQKWGLLLSKPVYQINNKSIIFDPKQHRDGFAGIKVVKNNIYALYTGFTREQYKDKSYLPGTNKIIVFNTDGKTVHQYILDKNIMSFCIDEKQKTLYGVSLIKNSLYVVQYRL